MVAIPGKVLQPPYPKWYDPGAKCVYHSGVHGHNIDSCIPFKYKVQHLISAGWLSFQEEGPNVKTNPLASHGGASVNAVEEDGPSRAKRLGEVATSRRFIYQSLQAACMVSRGDVATSRRFIYQSLQAACMISHGGDKSSECLFHLGDLHDMETCPAVEELLQRLMDWGQLKVSKGGREEPQICMQPEEKKVPPTPKALVICFTRNVTGSRPMYFIYQSLQAACMISHGGDKSSECLFHLGDLHDMETCPAVEELLQRLMDWGQLKVSKGGREEPQICMQPEEKKVPPTPKALVICFTRNVTGSRPMYPPTAPKPSPFAYLSNKAVPWKYTPPASSERVATEVDSLSAKVTNITGLSGITRSGRVFASPHPAELPSKGKAPMVQEPTDVATPSKEVDPPVVRGAEKKEEFQGKTVTLEEAQEFLRLIQQPKPSPFAYLSNKAVPWKYTPPASSERVATEVDSLSAKVTNITGLSGITRSGRVFASPHPAELPSKGKAPMVQEPTDVATPSKEVDPPVVRGAEKKEEFQGKTVTLEEAQEFLRLIQQSEFKVVEQLNKTPARISLLELLINSEPHRALLMKVLNEAHVAQDISVEGFGGLVNNITD